jgi:hypothetical protein
MGRSLVLRGTLLLCYSTTYSMTYSTGSSIRTVCTICVYVHAAFIRNLVVQSSHPAHAHPKSGTGTRNRCLETEGRTVQPSWSPITSRSLAGEESQVPDLALALLLYRVSAQQLIRRRLAWGGGDGWSTLIPCVPKWPCLSISRSDICCHPPPPAHDAGDKINIPSTVHPSMASSFHTATTTHPTREFVIYRCYRRR